MSSFYVRLINVRFFFLFQGEFTTLTTNIDFEQSATTWHSIFVCLEDTNDDTNEYIEHFYVKVSNDLVN
jgi:hypothetical protein